MTKAVIIMIWQAYAVLNEQSAIFMVGNYSGAIRKL